MPTNIQALIRSQRDSQLSSDEPIVSKVVDSVREPSGREQRGKYFACILYPDECEEHRRFLNYLTLKPYYKYCFIVHDRDIVKTHYHVMFKTLDQMTCSSVKKWFAGWVSHIEYVWNPKNYILYMLHESPNCTEDEKASYDISELHGNDELWKNVLVQNSHFVQLRELVSYQPYRGSFIDTYENIPSDRKEDLGKFMWDNRFFIKSILDEERNQYFEVPIDHEFVLKKHLHSDDLTVAMKTNLDNF